MTVARTGALACVDFGLECLSPCIDLHTGTQLWTDTPTDATFIPPSVLMLTILHELLACYTRLLQSRFSQHFRSPAVESRIESPQLHA